MRLHRFHIGEIIGAQAEFTVRSAELVEQIRRVFRLKTGDSVLLFDGSGSDYECRIAELNKESMIVDVVASNRSRFMPARNVYLCAAVVKKDTFEWIVEKATELGVTHIIPVMAERSEKKSLNEKRLVKIAIEASEQSGRGDVTKIGEIKSLEDTVRFLKDGVGSTENGEDSIQFVAFHTEGELFNGSDYSKEEPIAVFIGPEGGWSDAELKVFHENKISVRSLGNQVLRAETAVVAALSKVVFGK